MCGKLSVMYKHWYSMEYKEWRAEINLHIYRLFAELLSLQ